jgi:hypothetical protein
LCNFASVPLSKLEEQKDLSSLKKAFAMNYHDLSVTTEDESAGVCSGATDAP